MAFDVLCGCLCSDALDFIEEILLTNSNGRPYYYSSVSFFLLLFFSLFCARVFTKTARPIYIKNNIFWFELDRNFFYIDDLISVFEIFSIFILVFCLRTLIDIILIFLMLVKEELKFCRVVVLYV